MSRTKSASKKKTSPELKENFSSQASTQSSSSKKNDSEKSQDSKSKRSPFSASTFGYDSLAKQTLDLWREQLSHFLNNPEAMKDMNKALEPSATLLTPQLSQMFSPLFSGGMDIWLMMLEQLGKAANMNTPTGGTHAGAAGDQAKSKTAFSQAGQSAAAYRAENRSSATSALSSASTYAVAQLASRLADLEKRFAEFEAGGKPVTKKPAAKKKTAPAALAAVKGAAAKPPTAKPSGRKR